MSTLHYSRASHGRDDDRLRAGARWTSRWPMRRNACSSAGRSAPSRRSAIAWPTCRCASTRRGWWCAPGLADRAPASPAGARPRRPRSSPPSACNTSPSTACRSWPAPATAAESDMQRILARRAALHLRRGHQRDPARHHRARTRLVGETMTDDVLRHPGHRRGRQHLDAGSARRSAPTARAFYQRQDEGVDDDTFDGHRLEEMLAPHGRAPASSAPS